MNKKRLMVKDKSVFLTIWRHRRRYGGQSQNKKDGVMFVIIVLITLLAAFLLFLLHRGTVLTPGEALANYLEARRRGRTEEAYYYLCAAARSAQTPAEFKAANSLGSGLVAELLGRHISFIVDKMEVNDDRAEATVTFTTPDFPLMLRDIFTTLDPAALPEETLAAMTFLCRRLSDFIDKYHRDNLPLRTKAETFLLQREADGWKIAGPPPAGNPAG
jgi:hypothetical protein